MVLWFGPENDMNLLDIPRHVSVNWHEDWIWIDNPFVFYKWSIGHWNKQWTVSDIPNFEDLILKLGWTIWAIN